MEGFDNSISGILVDGFGWPQGGRQGETQPQKISTSEARRLGSIAQRALTALQRHKGGAADFAEGTITSRTVVHMPKSML